MYPGDVWTDVSHLQQKDPQHTGYDTQKPLALLSRIVLCSTQPGDLVADLFAGSGTTAAAAAHTGRRFLSADSSPLALSVSRKRLLDTEMTVTAPCVALGAALRAEFEPGIAFHDVRLLDAVDQWSVGFYQDGVFRCQESWARRKQFPALRETLQLPQLRGQPAIFISDVYGNRSVWIQKGE